MNDTATIMNTDYSMLPGLFKSEDRIRILRSVSLIETISVRGVSAENRGIERF